jgi:deoxyhypusine synthase
MRKITWGKLNVDTPRFVIESDATIVAPLVFAKILGGDHSASARYQPLIDSMA